MTALKRLILLPLTLATALAGAATRFTQDQCGPFGDVTPLFCPYVLEAYYTGITAGTSPTTFSPDVPITRGQAAVFVTKALNQALIRGSRRAALGQWWTTTPHYDIGLGVVAGAYGDPVSDGMDIWVGSAGGIARVRASDGRMLENWDAPSGAMLAAMGRIFSAPEGTPGRIYMIDPSQSPGTAIIVADGVGGQTWSIAFDGKRIWTSSRDGSISIVTPGPTIPWPATTLTPTGLTQPGGLVFDGAHMWITDPPVGKIHRLDSSGAILQTVNTGDGPHFPVFDGQNIWVPGCCGLVVIQASTGTVLEGLFNGLPAPARVAFDGVRVLVTSGNSDQVSLWDAATLTSRGPVSLGTGVPASGVCSDGVNFWLTLGNDQLARF